METLKKSLLHIVPVILFVVVFILKVTTINLALKGGHFFAKVDNYNYTTHNLCSCFSPY